MSEKLEVTKPKKRGRKPKNIIKDTSKTNDENKIENNLIIHLQKKDTDDNNGIDGFDIDSDFKELSYSFEANKKNPSFFCLTELSEKWKKLISKS